MDNTVDVVFPCLNEVEALPWVLGRLPVGYRAIVVDNGSDDGSAQVAAQLGAKVVVEPRRGFGSAAHAGLVAAAADWVAFCDCDASMDPAQLPELAEPVLSGEFDLMLGRRRPTGWRSWPPHARLANKVLARRLRQLTGVPVHDLGPMRITSRNALLDLGLSDRRSGYPLEMFLKAARKGWRIGELPIRYTPRTGASKVTGTIRGTWHAVRDMSALLRDA
ncbi:MAG TPA: glycosyltransferase family 2 protein, partial [Mycobacteriales bacterium]|nr:glycosyltransferase family 2 protein [Mycobacteriales bacterium]